MYKKIDKESKITRKISEYHSVDNYLTKDTTESMSMAVSYLDGNIETEICQNERAYYFIEADAEFTIDGEKVKVNTGDVLYVAKDSEYFCKGKFKAVMVNTPAFGVNKKEESKMLNEL